jgi:PBSX family phage portal protein
MGKVKCNIIKADKKTNIDNNELNYSGDWILSQNYMRGLKTMVRHSSVLPQCINAYKNNIAGFGIGIRYKDDIAETPEMIAEFTLAEETIELFNLNGDTKELFENIIVSRETYGIAYTEVIRNLKNEVVQLEFIKDTQSIIKTMPLEPYVETEFLYKGTPRKQNKKFCKYKQTINGKTVYFKEFSDPRIMNKLDGNYVSEIELNNQANEIIEFKIGTEPYGTVRWAGQCLGIDGSRKAENLNNNYFENGRHTPLAFIVKNGTLTNDSFVKLQQYMNGIKGEAGQHSFLFLEMDNDSRTGFENGKHPDIEIRDLASILQKDELFQEYLDNNRRRIQSSFQLPDLYVGYTTDFNRATAQTAIEITEKQVFQPERKSLAWVINNKLLNSYNFKFVEVYFKAPDITNIDELSRILSITERAGGISPNKAKEITYNLMNDNFEPYTGDWGDVPLVYSKGQSPEKTVAKSKNVSKDDEVIAIMKEVKKIIEDTG